MHRISSPCQQQNKSPFSQPFDVTSTSEKPDLSEGSEKKMAADDDDGDDDDNDEDIPSTTLPSWLHTKSILQMTHRVRGHTGSTFMSSAASTSNNNSNSNNSNNNNNNSNNTDNTNNTNITYNLLIILQS